MTANELADCLNDGLTNYTCVHNKEASDMLRQQEQEIVDLECEKEQQREKYQEMLCDKDIEIAKLKEKAENFEKRLRDTLIDLQVEKDWKGKE
jgi:Na+-translocating ferredoxin:NAD+ oxidoreductase RnfC subunit